MLKKIKLMMVALLMTVSTIGLPVLATTHAFADSKSDICTGVGIASGSSSTCSAADSSGLNNIVKSIVSILSLIVGVVAVIMIIIGGFRYIISGGDSSNTNAAKNTILYALIGLVIAALAQVLVHFVLAKTP